MRVDEFVSGYFNNEHAKDLHANQLLVLLMDYWATEKDYELKNQLLKSMLLQYASAERELVKLNDLRNRFMALAAHDLRSPLASTRGLSEILLDEGAGPLTAEQKELVATIYTASSTMLTLVNDILDLSVIESGRIKLQMISGSLKRLILERIRINKILASQKQMTIKHRLFDLPEFPFDRNRIAQVLDNLIGNAIKFSPLGSNIHVSLRKRETEAVVSVRDEGVGLRKEELSKIFDESQRIGIQPTGGEKSTGIGLAIAKRIVEEHSGALSVRSRGGLGSAFIFRLPMGESHVD